MNNQQFLEATRRAKWHNLMSRYAKLHEQGLEDVNSFTTSNLAVLIILSNALIEFFAFVGILWSQLAALADATHFLEQYFQNRAFYHISNDPTIDNPDQRLAEHQSCSPYPSLGLIVTTEADVHGSCVSVGDVLAKYSLGVNSSVVATVFGLPISHAGTVRSIVPGGKYTTSESG